MSSQSKHFQFLKLKAYAEISGFELLETEWLGVVTEHWFKHIESGKKRQWTPSDLYDYGFPKDLRTDQERSTDAFQELRQLAIDNGYELQGSEWLGSRVNHRFRHINSGKEYEWAPDQLFRQGFPKDPRTVQGRAAASFLKLKQLAQDNGYELLETQWLGSGNKHRFRDIESRDERAWAPNYLFTYGFPKDRRTDQDKFEQLRQLAQDNGFELLETQWLGAMKKHRLRHINSGKEREWEPDQLFSRGFPLADGQRFVTQEVIRQVFSHIFGGEFKTDRDRLKAGNNGRPLELDGYEYFHAAPENLKRLTGLNNEGQEMAFNLSVAFEFQGHPSHREKEETIRRDKLKAALCQKEGIHLMQIDPDLENESRFWNNVRDSDFMYDYVCKEIAAHFGRDIDFPPGFKIDLSNWNRDKESFKKLQELAENNGFELLETQWLGSATKHRFRHLKTGNEREWTPNQLFRRGFPKSAPSASRFQASFAEAKNLLAEDAPKDGSPDRLTDGQPEPESGLPSHDDIDALDMPAEEEFADAPAP